jgi:DNA polymerase-1
MPLFKTLESFFRDYEMPLARAFYDIDNRGVLIDQSRLEKFIKLLESRLVSCCHVIENEVKMKVVPKQPKGIKTPNGTLNLSSPKQLIDVITNVLKIKLKKDWNSGKESSGEEALNEAYSQSGNIALKSILEARELNKIKGTYAEAVLVDSILYTSYGVANTVTGRRSARATIFTNEKGESIGTNAQNLPKQSDLGKQFRECIIARPGFIFVSCDQVQAEDWIVSALIADNGGGTHGLDELKARVDRHKRLAMQIFKKPESECSKGTILRYMGKKTRHAGNYGMQAPRMAAVLASEGFAVNRQYCEVLLNEFHKAEPEIRNTFQYRIENELRNSRILQTPIGRTRYFLGLRPGADNGKLFKEAYSYIPQSTVGDNTGLAVLFCETTKPGWVIMDHHDAITLEVPDSEADISEAISLLSEAFSRKLIFSNGTTIEIPVEYEIGYDLKNQVEFNPKCPADLQTGLPIILHGLRQQARLR